MYTAHLSNRLLVSAVLVFGFLAFAPHASAAIVAASSSTGDNTKNGATSIVINAPSGVVSGDFLLANITVDKGTATSVTTPAGWTLIRRTDNSNKVSVATYYKVAGASEPSAYNWVLGKKNAAVGGIVRYTGVQVSNPLDTTSDGTGHGGDPTAPAVTTSVADEKIVSVFSIADNHTLGTAAGMTEIYDVSNPSVNGPATAFDDMTQVAPGSVATSAAALGNPPRDWAAQHIALRAVLPPPAENTVALCSDGIDNDFDNIIDLYDTDCESFIPRVTIVWNAVNNNGGTQSSGDILTFDSSGGAVPGTNHPRFLTLGGLSPALTSGDTFKVEPGTYTISPPGWLGYARSQSADCAGVILTGESKTCTITFDDIAPLLTVVTHVNNDNGGTAVASDFTVNVTGTNVSSSTFAGSDTGYSISLNAGAYIVSQVGDPAYFLSFSADCSGNIAVGQTKTCILANAQVPKVENTLALCTDGIDNDQDGTIDLNDADCEPFIPRVTIFWGAVNNNGGTQVSGDILRFDSVGGTVPGTNHPRFLTLGGLSPMLTSGDTFKVEPGAYTILPPGWFGYARTDSADCSGTILAGESRTCTISYDDIAPILTVVKHVNNNNGGSAVASDFTLTVTGTNVTNPSIVGNETGTLTNLDAGSYGVSEPDSLGYVQNMSADCTGTINIGQTKTCTIVNSQILPVENTLALCTDGVDNDFDGTSDLLDSDCEPFIPRITINWGAVNDNGGTQVSGDVLTFNSVSGTVPGTNHPRFLTLGGLSPVLTSGDTFKVEPGSYSILPPGWFGYLRSESTDCSGSIVAGETKICTISFDDIAPILSLKNIVVNNNGGTATTTDWSLFASGPSSFSGAGGVTSDSTFLAGTYALSESIGPSGYSASSWSCVGVANTGNTISLGVGKSAECTIVNSD